MQPDRCRGEANRTLPGSAGGVGGENIGTTASGRNRLVVGAVVGAEAVAVAGVIRGDSGGALGDSKGRDSEGGVGLMN